MLQLGDGCCKGGLRALPESRMPFLSDQRWRLAGGPVGQHAGESGQPHRLSTSWQPTKGQQRGCSVTPHCCLGLHNYTKGLRVHKRHYAATNEGVPSGPKPSFPPETWCHPSFLCTEHYFHIFFLPREALFHFLLARRAPLRDSKVAIKCIVRTLVTATNVRRGMSTGLYMGITGLSCSGGRSQRKRESHLTNAKFYHRALAADDRDTIVRCDNNSFRFRNRRSGSVSGKGEDIHCG